jgi:hypothetical protein
VLSSHAYFAGMVVAAFALIVIMLICRWVFAPTHTSSPPPPAQRADYGLLVPITLVRTLDDAHMLRALLREAGIRGTVADVAGGFAVLVFTDDAAQARALVRS